jgi:hypothetical protein
LGLYSGMGFLVQRSGFAIPSLRFGVSWAIGRMGGNFARIAMRNYSLIV